jgi:maltooligosyltrehalose trehalohydrolase
VQHRRKAQGAEAYEGGTRFRVWAPARKRVTLVLEEREVELQDEKNGYFSIDGSGVRAGARYRYRLDDEAESYPDPASRFQPEGPHGPSQVVDPSSYRWQDLEWRGPDEQNPVLYELHAGTQSRASAR